MESEAKYTLIGAFVVASLVFIVLAVMWLNNRGVREDFNWYTVYFKNANLSGLQLNSAVTMRGIKIGSVESLEISPKNTELVEVLLKVNKSAPVKVTTSAVVNRNLLTGLAFIDLQGATKDSAMLSEVLPGESYPVIPEGSSGIDKVASTLPELMSDATEVLGRANALLSDENLRKLEGTLANINTFSGALAKNSEQIEDLIGSGNELVSELEKVAKNFAKFSQPGDGELAKMSKEVTAGVAELKTLLENLNARVAQVSTELSNSMRVATQDINTAATGISQAARSFSATAEHLSDLRSFIAGPDEKNLGPGEMKPE